MKEQPDNTAAAATRPAADTAGTGLVSLSADSAHVKLSIKDDGRSDFGDAVRAERIEAGFGLRKIASYAERCGGSAAFENENGFRTEVELPFGQR